MDTRCYKANMKREGSCYTIERVVGRCSLNKVFLKISQKSQENTYAKVSF